jgi:hypothetical protein
MSMKFKTFNMFCYELHTVNSGNETRHYYFYSKYGMKFRSGSSGILLFINLITGAVETSNLVSKIITTGRKDPY